MRFIAIFHRPVCLLAKSNIHIQNNMDKEPQHPKSKSSHQREFGSSSTPTSLQWSHDATTNNKYQGYWY
ncbi:hypothetical protein Droror1_Dr00024405 [Drosera rotundifolia]